MASEPIDVDKLRALVAPTLKQLGWKGESSFERVRGGKNNQSYRVFSATNEAFLKIYFNDPRDGRNRLGAEYALTNLAWFSGIETVPKPLAQDAAQGFALYEFMHGRPLLSSEATRSHLLEALNLFKDLNRQRHTPDAQALPTASEACFSLMQHLETVERRITALRSISDQSLISKQAASFVANELQPAWARVRARVEQKWNAVGFQTDMEIDPGNRCLSPSDFGFHNAMVTDAGLLRFFDFEYAGWDDPAKMVCDFFCQPQVPVPLTFFDEFANTVSADTVTPELTRQRMNFLFPVYRIKWCCILLNEFLPLGKERRSFAGGTQPDDALKGQLEKSKSALTRMDD